MTTYDAIVVGAGPNGLVAANHLLDAGWSVLVLEAQATPGGAVRSDTEVHPDFVSDTFSACYPFAIASPAMRRLKLEDHGLVWTRAPAVLGHSLPDGRWALLHHEREDTAAGLDDLHPGDGAAWLELCRLWDAIGDDLVGALLTPFPPVRAGARLLTRLPGAGGLDLVRTLLTPVATLAQRRFGGPGPGLLLAGNAGHADFPLTSPGSGVFGLLMTMLAQSVGFPSPQGGSGELTAALVRRLESLGGALITDAEVCEVEVRDGRARGVRTADGERYAAAHAVLADVSAPALFGRLLAPEHVPARVSRGMRHFEMDPGTVKVDWALSGPVPWRRPPSTAPGVVHVGDDLAQVAQALSEVATGVVPAKPFLLSGQMTTSDPTRSPAGTESLWAYTHVPQPGSPVRDAGDTGDGAAITGRWDHDDVQRMGDRIQARFEALAPGFSELVVGRRVMGPHELEARDANLVGGAINGGTAQLHQEVFLRPVPGLLGRAGTGVPGLFLASAAAHPGGGVHGAPGANAARAAIAARRVSRVRRLAR